MARRPPSQMAVFEQLLAKHNRAIADAFLEAVQNTRRQVNLSRISELIEGSDFAEIANILGLDQRRLFPVTEEMRSAYVAGGVAVEKSIPRGAVWGFDGRHPRAERWIADQGARLVREISDDTMQVIQNTVRSGLERGRTTSQVARDLIGKINRTTGQREGGTIGLTAKQQEFVDNARAELQNLDRAYFRRSPNIRDRRFDAMIQKAIDEGKPLSQAQIDRVVDRYKDGLLQHRAKMIARDQAQTAINSGRDESYKQLKESGQVEDVVKRWQWNPAGQDARQEHQDLSTGEFVPVDHVFLGVGGVGMQYPHDPAGGPENNISCHCVAIYRIVPK